MTTRWVKARWPTEFKGGRDGFFARAGLRVKQVDSEGNIAITTEAQYERRAEDLWKLGPIGGIAAIHRQIVDSISTWPIQAPIDRSDPAVEAEMARLMNRESVTVANYLQAAQLGFVACPTSDFLQFVGSMLSNFQRALPNTWAATLNVSTAVHARQAVIRGLFTSEEAPEWYTENGKTFEAMRGLSGELFQGQATLVDPLLAVGFPWMLGCGLSRVGSGILVIGFGEPLAYKESIRDDDLSSLVHGDLLAGGNQMKVHASPNVTDAQVRETFRWWVEHASVVLSTALDPTLFHDQGTYRPALHLGHLHSIERLFASTLRTLLETGIDEYTRQIHLFEVLDLLQGFRQGDYTQTLDATRLQRRLDELEEDLPPNVAAVLLPRCRTALTALVSLQEGFAPSLVNNGSVHLPNGIRPLPHAVAMLLRQIRNGSHGMQRPMTEPASRRLFAIHDGVLPQDIRDLAFFHLVSILASPNRFEKPLTAKSSRATQGT